MYTINDVFTKMKEIGTAINNKGGLVNVANINPSFDELIAGIGTITGIREVTEMPVASASTLGGIFKYLGETNDDFQSGKFYMTLQAGGSYSWILVNETDVPTQNKAMIIAFVMQNDGTALSGKNITITNTATSEAYQLTTDRYGKAYKEVDPGTYTISTSDTISGLETPADKTITIAANQVDYSYMIFSQSVSRIFGENEPAAIGAASADISSKHSTYPTKAEIEAYVLETYGWAPGDKIIIPLDDGTMYEHFILGFNHDTITGTQNRAGICLQPVDCLPTRAPMNSSSTNAGGWPDSKLRNETAPTIKAKYPAEWQAIMVKVDKKSANGGSSNFTAVETTSDDLFPLAEIEVFGSVSYAQNGAEEGEQYSWYASHNTNADRIKKYDTDADGVPDTATYWWERSCDSGHTYYFCSVYTNGSANYYSATYSRGLALGFNIQS